MPIYIYKHPEEEKYIEVFQTMLEDHEYFDSEGLEWKRVFTTPNMSIDSQINPHSERDFIEKTASKKGTFGDMMDYSKEMSQKRAESNGGVDPVKEKYYSSYTKERGGARHFDQMKETLKKSKHVNVDFDK